MPFTLKPRSLHRLAFAVVFAASALVAFPEALIAESSAPVAKTRAAVFDFELIDTSLEGEVKGLNPAESERLVMISDLLRSKLAESGRYEVADLAPMAARIAEAGYLHSCNGCEIKIAADAQADLAVTGVVQKVSNLILNINIYIRDVKSGQLVRSASADIRGNTDRSWSHGVSWLARNRLLKP